MKEIFVIGKIDDSGHKRFYGELPSGSLFWFFDVNAANQYSSYPIVQEVLQKQINKLSDTMYFIEKYFIVI